MRKWTKSEESYLRKNYEKVPVSHIAQKLSRSIPAIWQHANIMGYKVRRGATKSPLYRRFIEMHRRCGFYPDRKEFKTYYLRRIRVCLKWKSFLHFERDMGPTFKPELTLERRDNNKGYSKKNCYWATREQQAHNRRRKTKLTEDNVMDILHLYHHCNIAPSIIASTYGVTPSTISYAVRGDTWKSVYCKFYIDFFTPSEYNRV